MSIKNHTYQVGVARRDITAPVGIRLIGYAVREGFSHGVDEPLTLTALAIKGRDSIVLIITMDAGLMTIPVADELRQTCADAVGIPAANVLVNFSHSHSTPVTGGFMDFDVSEQLDMQTAYRELLIRHGVEACEEALASMQSARIATGWGECHGNINRRQKDPDGNVLLGEDPDGTCDHSVGVIRIDDMSGCPIAVAYRYSCHTVTLGPKTNLISPDFIGSARSVIESQLHCPSLFLQGCAGNANPKSGIGQDPDTVPRFKEEKERMGHLLGSEVLKIAQDMRTHRKRSEPKLVQSVGVYWLYEYEPVPPGPEGNVRVDHINMELPLTPFPDFGELRKERHEWAARLEEATTQHQSEWVINPLQRFDHWAQRRLDAAMDGPNPLTVTFPLQTIRIDGLIIVALPFEAMMETGLDLREALGGGDTFVLGYSNGIVSYLPTPNISAEGGMEAKLGYKSYLLPSEVPGDWEPKIKQQVLEILST